MRCVAYDAAVVEADAADWRLAACWWWFDGDSISRRQQQEATITMSPHRRVADASYCRSVERIGSRVRPHDVTDDVIDHVTVSGHINTAVDRRDLDS